MERTYKTWGQKWNIFQNDLNEVSYLDLQPNQRCSWHRHDTKSNLFFVIEGVLHVKTEWGTANVAEGEIFTTRPGDWHEFQTGDSGCRVIEVMFVKYDPEDIEREKVGGPIKDKIGQCKNCGTDLSPNLKHYESPDFCSGRCAAQYEERPPEINHCKYCGNDLKPPETNFCNTHCAQKYNESKKLVQDKIKLKKKGVWKCQ